MSSVQIMYFAAVRELVGREQELVELPMPELCVAEFRRHLQQVRPVLNGRLSGIRIAVNECFAEDEEQVADGDVVALIPPVAGG